MLQPIKDLEPLLLLSYCNLGFSVGPEVLSEQLLKEVKVETFLKS